MEKCKEGNGAIYYQCVMRILSSLYRTILDALFPLSPTESGLFAMPPETALQTLPPAPDYSGLAVDLPYARSVFAYKDERVSRLIWHIKEKRTPEAMKIGGHALFSELEDMLSSMSDKNSIALIVPIPITSQRRRERGYNQCELLMEEVARLQEKVGSSTLMFDIELLIRTGSGAEQKYKNRKERVESAQDIFSVNALRVQKYERGIPIIVIDDVITTGSTMHEAIETLRRAGFSDIRALSLAH